MMGVFIMQGIKLHILSCFPCSNDVLLRPQPVKTNKVHQTIVLEMLIDVG